MTIGRTGLALKSVNGEPADVHLDESGHLPLVFDAEAVGQHAGQRLKTFEKEWFLDNQVGVIWLSEILGFGYDQAMAEAVTKSELLDTDGVTDISSFSVSFNRGTRELLSKGIIVKTEYDEEVQL